MAAMTVKNLVEWYVERNLETIKSTEEIAELEVILKGVIRRLLYTEKTLKATNSDVPFIDMTVEVHPNFVSHA